MGFDVEEYSKKRKSQQKEKTEKSGFDVETYVKSKYASQVAEDIATRVNDWLKRNESFINSYNSRYGENTSSYRADSSDWLSNVTSQTSDFGKEAEDIKSLLEEYSDFYDTDWVKNVRGAVDSSLSMQNKILSNSTKDHEYWSQWENEDAYNAYLAYQKDYEEKLNFNLDAGQRDIDYYRNELNAIASVENQISAIEQENQTLMLAKAKGDRNSIEKLKENEKRLSILNETLKSAYEKYGSREDLESYISEKNAYLTLAQRAQKAVELASVADVESENYDPEFNSYAQQGKALDDGSKWTVVLGGKTQEPNPIEYYRRLYSDSPAVEDDYGAGKIGDEAAFALAMTEEEVKIYDYYLAKDGKEKAQEYLDSIEESVNSRVASGYFKQVEDKPVLEYLFGVTAGLDQFASGIENLFSDKDYIPTTSIQMASGMVREDLEETGAKLPDWLGGASIGQVGYDVINTTSNMLPSILAATAVNAVAPVAGAAVGAGMLGASAGGNAKAEMLNLGYSKEQANAYGVMVAIAEGGMEYFLGGITKLGGKLPNGITGAILNKVDNAFARAAIKIGGSMVSEGLEEGLQTVIEPWLKEIATGVDWEDPNIDEVLYSSLLGALSAFGLEGAGVVAGEVGTYKSGKTFQQVEGGVAKLQELGSTFSADTVAYKIASKVDAQTDAYTIGRLLNEVGGTISEQNLTDIVNGLTQRGMDTKTATKLAKQYQNFLNNEMRMTDEQVKILENLSPLADVLRTDIIGSNTTVYQRTRGYANLMKLADEVSNGKKSKASEPETAETSSETLKNAKSTVVNGVSLKNEVDVKGKVSEEGKTTKVSTGEVITIDKGNAIAKTKVVDGEKVVYYNTDHGVVEATDVTYANEAEGLLYEAFSDMNPAFANAAIKNYDGSVPVQTYIDGMREGIVLYGMHNFQAVGKDISRNSDLAALSEADQAFALKLGRAYAKANVKESDNALKTAIKNAAERAETEGKTSTTSSKNGSVRFENGARAKTTAQKRAVSLAKHLSKAIGIDIVFYDATVKGTKHSDSNGYFDPKDNSIHLDLQNAVSDSKTIVFTMSHELVHFIKKWSPAKFNTFANFLMEQYAAHGVSTSTLLANKMAALGTTDADLAYEEMIADACERMLLDSNAVVKLMELRKSDLELFEKIKLHVLELLNNIRDAFKGVNPNTEEGIALQKMEDVLGKLHEMFEDAAVDAAQNYQAIGARNLEDFSDAKNMNGEPLFQYKAMQADEKSYRSMLTKWGKMTDTQVNNLFNTIDTAIELIKDNLEILDYAWEADIDDRAFSPVKPNSDKLYQVSLDFSTLCRKRLLQQTVQAQLQEALKQPLTKEEGIAIRDALIALQEEGRQIEVACALCYVEAARMKSPDQIKKFLNNREAVIKEFFAGKSGGSMKEKINQAEADVKEKLHNENPNGIKGKDGSTMLDPRTAKLNQLPKKYADEIRAAKKAAKESYTPTAEEQSIIEVAKGMTVSDFTTPEGLENLAKKYPPLFDAYTSYVRNATKSKGIENDTWWRAGDSERIGDVLIANMNRENGLRSQSWSDFQVIHILDYIAATIELATRNAKEQAYSKVPDYVELMGNTGVMINMSLIPTAKFNGKLEYDSTEGIDYKRSLELRDKYHATAGTICIGVDNVQIQLLLEDVTIDYVIPFHRSGMSAHIRKAMHIPTWSEYQDYQGEGNLSRAEAESRAKKYGVTLLSESDPNYQKGTSFSEWFDLKEAQQIAKMENANPSDKAKHKKYGVMYGGYMAMQNAANNYLKLCAERGLSPKFSHEKADFTAEDNYWKLLIDRKMVDNVTGEVIEQQSIKPIFEESEIMRILNDELERYPQVKEDQDYALRTVTEKFLSGEVKGGMSAEAIAKAMKKPVDNVTNVNILSSSTEILEFDSSEEKITQNIEDLAMMSSVYDVDESKLIKTGKKPADIFAEHFESWGNFLRSDELGDIAVRHSSVKSEIRHGLTAEKIASIEAIPTVIKEGKVIFVGQKTESGVQRIVVCAPITIGENAYYMGVMLQRDARFQRLYLHNVAIVKEASEISQDDLLTTGAHETNESLFVTSILQNALTVKYQKEKNDGVKKQVKKASDKDSEGNELSDEQIEFFKDSKVRDSKGRLLVMYHGTTANFNTFKKGDIGFHFGTKAAARGRVGYGKNAIMKRVHLNITNPIVFEEDLGSWDADYRLTQELFERDILTREEVESVLLSDDKSYRRTTEKANKKLAEILLQKGYDGIAYSNTFETKKPTTSYIAFQSNQAKVVENEAPTSNPDIRYQKKQVTNRILLADALESAAQNDIEKNKLALYKSKIALIESEQAKLEDVRKQANDIRFTKGRTPEETKRMKALDFEANQIANRINTYDRQLLNLESTAALKNVLQREKEMVRKKTEQKGKEALKKAKEKRDETIKTLMQKNREARERGIESRSKTEMRGKIKSIVSDLNTLLLNPTKDKHVPIGLQKPVAAALDIINMDTVGADERIAKYDALIAKANDPDVIASLKQSRDRIALQGETLSDNLTTLKPAYAEIKNSDDPLVKNSHDEAIENLIDNTIDKVGNTAIRDMSLEQLEAVYDMFKAIKATVRNANKMFKEGRQETVTENSEAVKTEVRKAGGHRDRVLKATKWLKKVGWDMLKPLQAMRVIGSDTFAKLFENVRKGEDTWAVDVSEAKDFFKEKAQQYGYGSWDFKKQYTFKDSVGNTFSLSLEQIMSLYAYSNREQADRHLEVGGFIFDDAIEVTEKGKLGIPMKYEVNDANPYRLRREDLGAIIGILDTELKDVKGFVDEMQAYLSDVMGEKGNEVSLAMYDIKLYNEKHYFPLKTARYFREFDPEKNATPKIKNSGFSKKTVPQAGNPIVLSNFMDVWANHVNDMSMYHAFVLPLEDFMRVYNYSSTAGGYDSVQQYIKNAYGSQANQYIERLMEDLNGGARVDSSAGVINKGIGLFKKASVFASASVVVQQPSAIARALAYVDAKYFVDKPEATKHKETWAEVKKYAPVAIIKEMGYFDTNMGRSTVDWIRDEKTLMNKIDDVASKAPALADELAWCAIWKAVKREVAATTNLKVGSEELLKRAGERFTEVVANTQVYDSVLSRSGMMRSKDTGMKMATAFMAEPTTSLNMVVDAIIQGKRGNKKFATKTVGAVAASVILNSILVSLVYAARDDDEDETYAEKYLASLTSELIDGFNPLTYIPFVKDIWSIAQGYDVERSDMSVVSKLWESIENLFNDNKSGFEKVEGVVGAIASFFGLPLKNLMRDARAMYNLTTNILSGTPTTKAGVAEAVGEAAKSSIPLWSRIEKWAGAADSKPDKLYDAIMSGDEAHADRLKGGYKDEKAVNTAIRAALRENDPRIKKAAKDLNSKNVRGFTDYLNAIVLEGHFDEEMVEGAIRAEASYFNSKVNEAAEAKNNGDDEKYKKIVREMRDSHRGVYTQDEIVNLVKKAQKDQLETKDDEDADEATSIYRASDINAAFESGDNAIALQIIDDLVKTKVANGMKESNAKSSVKSSMTSYWKPLYKAAYKAGDTEEMRRIRLILKESRLYGRTNDILDTCRSWIREKD